METTWTAEDADLLHRSGAWKTVNVKLIRKKRIENLSVKSARGSLKLPF